MNRKILFLITILALGSTPLIFTGCSSSEEQTDASVGSDDGLDSGELSEDGAAPENPTSEADVAGTPLEGAPSDAPPADVPAADAGNPDDIVADLGDDPTGETAPEALPDQAMGGDAAPPADAPLADNATDSNVPPPADGMDAGAPPDAPPPLGADTGMPTEAPAPRASLKKVKDAPFKSNGRILNTVYVARKGDTTNKVAEKVFGDKKRKKELIADNSMLAGRGVKEGDKIYYNSPRRPDDTTTMMTYYEDNGIPAQSYVSKDGDDLKKVAKELLGSRDGWKELWVTNPNLESKGALSAGQEIRYWIAPPAEQTVAAAPPPPADVAPPPPTDMPPPPAAGTTAPPPDLNNMPPPSDSLPPPPPPPTGDMNAMPPPPPPPPDTGMAQNDFPPPPPPPPGANGKKTGGPEDILFQDQETTMAIGAGAIILLSVILIMVHRIKKGRAQRMRLGQTQV